MRTIFSLVAIPILATACSSEDSSPTPAPSSDGGATDSAVAITDSGAHEDSAAPPLTDSGTTQDAAATDPCGAATATLQQTADPGAPVLDRAKSNLQRVISATNDAFCAGHGNNKFPGFGPYGYQLSIFFTNAENDGPTSLDDVQTTGVVHLASDPDIQIMTRTDQAHWSTGGGAIIIQMCLDKVYQASEITVGFDVADKAGHRSKAICIQQQAGG